MDGNPDVLDVSTLPVADRFTHDDGAAAARLADDRAVDAELLARLIEGDTAALKEAYDIHSSLVFGLARRVTNDHAAASDIAQEVFLQLWEQPDRVDLTRGSLRAYLGVVTHRRALDVVRSRTRRDIREDRVGRDEPLETATHETDVVEADDALRKSDRLRAALAQLPTDQRLAVDLAYFGGHTYREVADRLGIPEGTAKSRLRLALARLRSVLDADGGDDEP